MNHRTFTAFVLALPLIVASQTAPATQSGAAAPGGPKAHWTYSGAEGPNNWGDLSTAYEVCKSGKMQSPVNLQHPQGAGMSGLTFDYNSVPLKILNNGHTIQVNYGQGSSLTSGNRKYDLLQLHFHTPSEHVVTGKSYPMEMHFVHKAADGTLGVVGVFFKQGKKNIALQEIWNHLPRTAGGEATVEGIAINGYDLLPKNRDYFRLVGSLTTPPCSENVQWHIFKDPIEASSAQIQAFSAIIGQNNRPVQQINNRLLIDSGKAHGASATQANSH